MQNRLASISKAEEDPSQASTLTFFKWLSKFVRTEGYKVQARNIKYQKAIDSTPYVVKDIVLSTAVGRTRWYNGIVTCDQELHFELFIIEPGPSCQISKSSDIVLVENAGASGTTSTYNPSYIFRIINDHLFDVFEHYDGEFFKVRSLSASLTDAGNKYVFYSHVFSIQFGLSMCIARN